MRGKITCMACLVAGALLSGCAGTDLAELNQKISDFGYAVSGKDPSGNSTGGMPGLALNTPQAKEDKNMAYAVAVDVDTAAARLRRYYKFMTTEELDSIRNRQSTSAKWVAGAVEEEHPVWVATPGSYYKMGNDWMNNDHLEIELEKNGAGSRLYITYSSPNPKHLTSEYLQPLFIRIKDVAEGKVR